MKYNNNYIILGKDKFSLFSAENWAISLGKEFISIKSGQSLIGRLFDNCVIHIQIDPFPEKEKLNKFLNEIVKTRFKSDSKVFVMGIDNYNSTMLD